MERPTKRQKLEKEDQQRSNLVVTRPDEIHRWLEFSQSTDLAVRDGINSFKNYLSSISQLDDVAQQSKQLRILKEYCEWQKAPSEDQIHFYDLLSTWSFAIDNNAEAIISAVPAALAQFLRTISGLLELRVFGLALVDTLLQRDQSKFFAKCLASPRSKPHLASPCLRLLTEMVSFDAGARFSQFWARRDLVMSKFDALLEQQNASTALDERRKPSVRRMGLRLLLAMLKYFDADAKADLLAQSRAVHACLRGLLLDGDDIILDILRSLNRSVILDKEIPRSAIIKFFNSTHLECLAALYRFEVEDDQLEVKDVVRDAAHQTLLLLCTTEHGVVLPGNGWYSQSSTSLRFQPHDDDHIDLGLDSPFYDNDPTEQPSVANTVLSLFLQRLRPHEDSLQSQLLLTTLQFAPELVAEYFSRRKHFPAAASEDVSWRSAFALLFSVIEFPVPTAFGWRDGMPEIPPQPTAVVENILPRHLDRTYLTKLLSSGDDVLKISGARILTVSLKKLDKVLSAFSRFSHKNNYLWDQAGSKTSDLVESRIPVAREVLLAYQHTSHTAFASYAALLECIATYYEVLPDVAATSMFDIAPVMSELCATIEQDGFDSERTASTIEQLLHAVKIAELSSSTKWLHKANNDVLSPLGQVLATIAQVNCDESKSIAQSLRRVLIHRGVLQKGPLSFASLLSSLESSKKFTPSPELFLFIDNCVVRANQKPVRYLDDIEHTSRVLSDKKPLSLFIGAIPEQWSHACKKHEHSKSAIKTIGLWIARIFTLLDSAGENYRVMMHLQQTMLGSSIGKSKEYLQDAFDKIRKKPVSIDQDLQIDDSPNGDKEMADQNSTEAEIRTDDLSRLATAATPIPQSLSNLDQWPSTLDIELEVQTHRLPKLILCASSSDEEIRLQAFQLLQSIAYTVDTSTTYEGKSQIYLLLGEMIETIRQYGLSQPPPTLIPELTNALLYVLVEPAHEMYAKVNKFLLHSPVWTPRRTITYWLEKILLREPDTDEPHAFLTEVQWLLTWLLNSLRNELDMDLYRRSGLWERIMSLYVSPTMSKEAKILILAMLWKGCEVPGGADMLWTRFGVYNWLESMIVVDAENKRELQMVQKKMVDSCDREMIGTWKVTCALNRVKKMGVD